MERLQVDARRNARLTDVAAEAGVSPTTVSYVLGGRSKEMRIALETEARVREAAAALGYRPNRSARSLRTAKSATIAVISDFVASGHFASQMLAGASSAAREPGHVLLIGETEGDPAVERHLVEEFLERQVDGFVYATLVHRQCRVPAMLAERPLVLLNCVDPSRPIASVIPDDTEGGKLSARVLLAAGCRSKIFVVGKGRMVEEAGPQRLNGIHEQLGEAGLGLDGIISCEWTVVDAYEAVNNWLAKGSRADER